MLSGGLQDAVSVAQAIGRTAIANRTAFGAGCRQVFGEWQQQAAQALRHNLNEMPLRSVLSDMLRAGGMAAASERAPVAAEEIG